MVADRSRGKFIARMTASLVLGAASAGGVSLPAGAASVSNALPAAETLYADLVDGGGIIAAIARARSTTFRARTRPGRSNATAASAVS